MTQNVKAAADSGYFADRTWLTQVDAVFAEMYFDTMDAWHAGRTAEVPKAWRTALTASDDRSMTGLGDFMLNMNAHINNDFPHALATVGLTAADGSSHKPDHNAYNQRLDSLYIPVFREEAERFDPTFDDYDAGPLDDAGVGTIMRGWREMVWRHAEELATASTPTAEAARRAADRGVRRRPGRPDQADVRLERRIRRTRRLLRRTRLSHTGERDRSLRCWRGCTQQKGPRCSCAASPTLPTPEEALPGRTERPFHLAERHKALDAPLVTDEVPEGYEVAVFGLGCFWGAEEIFWQVPGVWSTSVGYAGGATPHPSYEEVCSGRTGHTEAVRVVYDPAKVSYADLVATFYEVHDPTQGMRQGNDMGTQYRSAIYYSTPEQEMVAQRVTEITARADQARLRPDHHRDQARRRDAVLLRRGPPPAVPARTHSATAATRPPESSSPRPPTLRATVGQTLTIPG